MANRTHGRGVRMLVTAVTIGLVSAGADVAGQSRAARMVREPIPAPQQATDADVERLIRAIDKDPLLAAGIALQDLANGNRELDGGTLMPFLQLAGYAPTTEPNGCRHIKVPYGSSHATVHLTVLSGERLLTMGILLREYSSNEAGTTAARTLAAQTLAAQTLPGAGRFDYDAGRLMIVHSLPLQGLSTVGFERGLGQMMARVVASQSTWARPLRR